MSAPLILLEDWGWRHAGRAAWALRGVNLRIEPGERVLLLGASGAGKSTLLHALAGVLGSGDEGEEEGRLLLGGAHPSPGQTALVMQDPASQLVLSRVGDDVAFGLENLAVPRSQIWGKVRSALIEVGLPVELDRSTGKLSGGEQQRLVLAGALAMGAGVLLLDEPTANLDPAGVLEVRDAVAAVVADRSRTLIVVEHHSEIWAPLVDRVIVLEPGGGVLVDGTPSRVFADHGDELAALGVWVPSVGHQKLAGQGDPVRSAGDPGLDCHVAGAPRNDDDLVLLQTEELATGYTATPTQEGLNIALRQGESTVITGANGVGKTATALTLAGLLPRCSGSIRVEEPTAPTGRPDPETWKSKELLTRIGTVFQNPEHQFVANTVFEEIAVGLRALKRTPAEIQARVEELLGILHLEKLAKANPYTLSGGEKRRLSVGTVLAVDPALIVLDEPTFGQDRRTWNDLVSLIGALRDAGTTILSVTHDAAYVEALGDQLIELLPSTGGAK